MIQNIYQIRISEEKKKYGKARKHDHSIRFTQYIFEQ